MLTPIKYANVTKYLTIIKSKGIHKRNALLKFEYKFTEENKSKVDNSHVLTKFNPRSHSRHYMEKDNTKLVTTQDIISGSHVSSHFPSSWILG